MRVLLCESDKEKPEEKPEEEQQLDLFGYPPVVSNMEDKLYHLSLTGAGEFIRVGLARNGYDALKTTAEETPDVVILDVDLPDTDVPRLAASILTVSPNTRIVFVGSKHTEEAFLSAIHNGAQAFILKSASEEELAAAMRAANSGQYYASREIACGLIAKIRSESPMAPPPAPRQRGRLRDAQRRVIDAVSKGYTNSEIAAHLQLSAGTVANYISEILHKTGLRSRTELAAYALQRGFSYPLTELVNREYDEGEQPLNPL